MLPSPAWKTLRDLQARTSATISPIRRSTSGSRSERDRAVHAHVVGDLAHRAEGGLAALPDARGLLAEPLSRISTGSWRLAIAMISAQLVVDLLVRALDLDDQQRLASIGIVRADMGIGRL